MNSQAHLNLERQRSAYVFATVLHWDDAIRGAALDRCKGLPVEVRSQGLMVTMAKLLDGGPLEEIPIADVLARWLLQECPFRTLNPGTGRGRPGNRLLAACQTADRRAYLLAQAEGLALLQRLKLVGEALVATAKASFQEAISFEHGSHPMRIAFAFELISSLTPEWRERLAVKLKGLPVEVQTEGLLTALCNLLRASREPGTESARLAGWLALWLLSVSPRLAVEAPANPTEQLVPDLSGLLERCCSARRTDYQALQTEALAFLNVLKTYAVAFSRGQQAKTEEAHFGS